MKLKYFKAGFVEKLQAEVEKNIDWYQQDDLWIEKYAGGKEFALDTTITLPDKFELLSPGPKNLNDLENVKRLHQALKALSPIQASDPRFWAYLSHVTFWPYMRKRWVVEEKPTEQRVNYVLSHYFLRTGSSRSIIRNGIANLWWYGFLTYDEDRKNPYELTEILLKKLDIARNILERNLGRNRVLLQSFLEFLLENPKITESGNKGREIIRVLVRKLNCHGGVCVLDTLNIVDIKAVLKDSFAQAE
jgi:Family of unknown function (DUF6339)